MKKYTFKVQNKRVYDYDNRGMVTIDYNPKITIEMLQSFRYDFERGFDGAKRNFAEIFKVLETTIKDTLTVETNIDFDFTNFKYITLNSSIKPMRKRNYTKFSFDIELETKE